MQKTGLVYSPVYLKHNTGQHVEVADRLSTAYNLLRQSPVFPHLVETVPDPVGDDVLQLVHPEAYQRHIQEFAARGGGFLDPDTVVSPASYDVALLAAGGAVMAVRDVLRSELDNAFCLIRPPGHHALPSRAMGFCLFNNAAIAARYAQQHLGVERILILDWDVHHGNGTQDIFYRDPSVLYVSWHQTPNWPGTGAIEEVGEEQGRGFTVNFPFPIGTGFAGFAASFDQLVTPIARSFRPELILVSSGFDSHWRDPIGRLGLSVSNFAELTRRVVRLADTLCRGRLVLLLEGGYNLNALAQSILASIQVLQDRDAQVEDPWGDLPAATTSLEYARTIDTVVKVHREFWPLVATP